MIDPAAPLQKAVFSTLEVDAGVRALVAGRIFDRVPDKAAFPYVTLGAGQGLPDDDQCHSGAESFLQVDVWSRAVGQVEAKRIAAAVAVALDAPIAVEGHEIIIHEVEGVRHLKDPDGLTSHSLVTLRYVTAPNA